MKRCWAWLCSDAAPAVGGEARQQRQWQRQHEQQQQQQLQNELQRCLEDLRWRLAQQEKEKEQLTQQLHACSDAHLKVISLQQEVVKSQSQISSLRQRLDARQQELECLESRAQEAYSRVDELEGRLQDCQDVVAQLQTELLTRPTPQPTAVDTHALLSPSVTPVAGGLTAVAAETSLGTGADKGAPRGSGRPTGSAQSVVPLAGSGPGAPAVAALHRLLSTGSLEVGFGVPEIEAELERVSQVLQLVASLPCWDTGAMHAWARDTLQINGLELNGPVDAGLAGALVQHHLLHHLNNSVFASWPSWLGQVLGSSLLEDLQAASHQAAHHHRNRGAALVLGAACMVQMTLACRAWLPGAVPQPEAPVSACQSEVIHRLATEVHNSLRGAMRWQSPETLNAISHCVQAAIRLWILLKAAHPLLHPVVSPSCTLVAPGAVAMRRVQCSRLPGLPGLPGKAGDLPRGGGGRAEEHLLGLLGDASADNLPSELVLASLCPAAAFTDVCKGLGMPQEADQVGGGVGGAPQVLVSERVATLVVESWSAPPAAMRGSEVGCVKPQQEYLRGRSF